MNPRKKDPKKHTKTKNKKEEEEEEEEEDKAAKQRSRTPELWRTTKILVHHLKPIIY